MTLFQRITSRLSVAAILLAGAGSASSAYADQAPAPTEAGPRGHGDLLRASLRLDSLTATQRQQIEGLAAQEMAAHANVRVARAQLLEAVASGVAAGNVDDIALSPNVHAVESAVQADEPGDRATLEKLHGILTAAQRVELVSRIESHMHGHARHEGGSEAGAGQKHGGMWGHDLNLTHAQKDQIRVNLRSIGPAADKGVGKEARDAKQHVLEAFKGDRFVMREVAPPRDPRVIEEGALHVVRFAKASAPVLTPGQRSAAAAKLRAEAARDAGQTK